MGNTESHLVDPRMKNNHMGIVAFFTPRQFKITTPPGGTFVIGKEGFGVFHIY